MISLKELNEEYLCVSQVIASYGKSKNKGVAKSSKLLSQGYKDLAANNQHMIETTKSMLNSMSADKIKPGDLADRVSDSEIAKKKAWKKVYEAIDIGIEAVNEKTKPTSKKQSNLKYSDEWRNMIIEELKKGFKGLFGGCESNLTRKQRLKMIRNGIYLQNQYFSPYKASLLLLR